jgi:hypothetical protein
MPPLHSLWLLIAPLGYTTTNLSHLLSTFSRSNMIANALQIGGLAAIAIGAGLIFIPAGIVAAGIGLVLFGLALERD